MMFKREEEVTPTKAEALHCLDDLARNDQKPGETFEQSYTRLMKSELGQVIYRHTLTGPDPTVEAVVRKRAGSAAERPLFGEDVTPAERAFAARVEKAHQDAPPDQTIHQTFQLLWTSPSPDHVALREKARAERMAARAAG